MAIYARRLPPIEETGIGKFKEMQQAITEPEEAPYVRGFGSLKAAKLLREAQKPEIYYTPRSLAEAASKARLPVPERQGQQVPQQRRVITEEDERILTAQAGGRAAIPQQIENLASKGRHGDTMLMHVNPDELKGLSSLLGPTTTNPDTGLPEAFLWWLPLIGAALGGIATGSWKGAALGGLAGLGGAFAAPALGLGGGAAGAASQAAAAAGAAGGGGTALTQGALAAQLASATPWTAYGSALAPGSLAGVGGSLVPAATQAGILSGATVPLTAATPGMTTGNALLQGAQALNPTAATYASPTTQGMQSILSQTGLPQHATTQLSGTVPKPSWWERAGTGIQNFFTGQDTDFVSGTEEATAKGGAGPDIFGGIKKWWEPKSTASKVAHVAGAGAGLAALAQPKQTDFGFQLPIKEVSEFTFEEDDDKDPRIPKTFTQAELEEAAEVGPVPSFFAKEGGLLSVIKRQGGSTLSGISSMHPAIISAGPQAVAQEVERQHMGNRYPTSAFGNPQTRATTHPLIIDALSQRSDWPSSWGGIGAGGGNGGIPATVVPPFEFPEVTPFRSVAPFSSSDRLATIAGQPTTPVDFSQITVEDQFVPSTNIPDVDALSDLFSRFEQAQGDPIIDLVTSTEAIPAQNGGLLGLANGGIPNVFAGHVRGVGDGMSDQIPFRVVPQTPQDIPKAPDMAVLSTDEYVFPADAVSMLGNGSSDAGAKILDNAVKSVRRASIGTPKQITEIDGQKVLGGALTT